MSCVTPSNQVPISNGQSLDIYQILNHFSSTDVESVFGQELESVKALLNENLEDDSQPVPTHGTNWIEIQMAKSAYDLDKQLSPRISKRGFLEKTNVMNENVD